MAGIAIRAGRRPRGTVTASAAGGPGTAAAGGPSRPASPAGPPVRRPVRPPHPRARRPPGRAGLRPRSPASRGPPRRGPPPAPAGRAPSRRDISVRTRSGCSLDRTTAPSARTASAPRPSGEIGAAVAGRHGSGATAAGLGPTLGRGDRAGGVGHDLTALMVWPGVEDDDGVDAAARHGHVLHGGVVEAPCSCRVQDAGGDGRVVGRLAQHGVRRRWSGHRRR